MCQLNNNFSWISFANAVSLFKLGTKSDLEVGINIVHTEEGERLMRKINANQFLECSAKNYENINEVVYEGIRAAVAGVPAEPEHSYFDIMRNYLCCYSE